MLLILWGQPLSSTIFEGTNGGEIPSLGSFIFVAVRRFRVSDTESKTIMEYFSAKSMDPRKVCHTHLFVVGWEALALNGTTSEEQSKVWRSGW